MPIHIPAQVSGSGLIHRRRYRGQVGRDVVFETVLADEMQQLLHMGNLNDTRATKGVQWVVGELALADVASHPPGCVVGGEAGKAHLFRLDQSHTRTERVFFTHGAGNDFLEIHFHRTKEVLGQIRAMEADRFIGISSVVIVPVEKRGGRLRSQA